MDAGTDPSMDMPSIIKPLEAAIAALREARDGEIATLQGVIEGLRDNVARSVALLDLERARGERAERERNALHERLERLQSDMVLRGAQADAAGRCAASGRDRSAGARSLGAAQVGVARRVMSMKLAALIAALVSAARGVMAALAMTRGAQPVPWSIQSHSGLSDAEKVFQRKTKHWLKAGLWLLAGAFVFAAASAVLGYLAP